jgi:hypothetical protein
VRSDLPSPFFTGRGGRLSHPARRRLERCPSPSAVTSLTLRAESLPYPHGNSSYPRPGSFHPRRRIDSAEDAGKEALALWEERERRRSEILAAVDIAQASTARGEGIEITRESMRELAEDVKRRGRARLAAEQREMPR